MTKKFIINIIVIGKWRVSWYYNEFPTGCYAIVRVMTAVKTSLMIAIPVEIECVNTFAASYLNTQGLNNSCLKSPASTLVDLTFQSRALHSFSLNQLRNLSL